ncbi:MAG: hypothetical protein ABEI96_08510 [Haloarculaceae archaeon]
MSTYADAGPRTDASPRTGSRTRGYVPAYGPVDAAFGFALFYVLVDRATPTVVAVLTDALADVSPSFVRLGLAAVLWFVLGVTVLDQFRRQLAALGLASHHAVRPRTAARGTPSRAQTVAYALGVVVGGAVAAWTFERAVETAVSLIRVVAALDAGAFVSVEFLVMVVFFVAFGVATHSLDRLVVGGVRALLADESGRE